MLEEGLLKDKQAMRQKLKVRNQFEAWPGGTFCLFLLHHRECFVLLNPQVIKSGGEKCFECFVLLNPHQIWWRERIVGARQTEQL